MNKVQKADYTALDHPEICMRIFHPRPEPDKGNPTGQDHLIQVDSNVHIGARFHMVAKDAVTILFFHGNGEIAADYDDVGAHFNGLGINFIVVDYRGYGRSGGIPNVSAMMNDCYTIFDYTVRWLEENAYGMPLIIMGRSLGSASAFELAMEHPDTIAGLIIESGFAFTEPLLELLGIDTKSIGFDEATSFGNLFKMATYQGPCLLIHAEHDHLIPFSDGQALYDVCQFESKRILKIANADHNDILFQGWNEYFDAIEAFVQQII
jgi:alpha-beta hydrolase superfamily lysophospholipase